MADNRYTEIRLQVPTRYVEYLDMLRADAQKIQGRYIARTDIASAMLLASIEANIDARKAPPAGEEPAE